MLTLARSWVVWSFTLLPASMLLAAPLYPPPSGGWAYELTGDQALSNPGAALDGAWNHDNGSDSWSGDARGAGVGLVGGISAASGILTLEDGLTTGSSSVDNRRFYLTHDVAADAKVLDGANLLDNGVTLYFRARLTPPPPGDPLTELSMAPNGFVNQGAGKGMLGIKQAGGSGMIISFSLNLVSEDTSPSTSLDFGQAGLHMNNLNGDGRSPFVDPDGSGTRNVLALNPAVFHDFWITIVSNGTAPGTHRVSVYVDGAVTPAIFNVTAGTGNDGPAASYLALGGGSATQVGAFDLDFLAYREGVVAPATFDQPAGILTPPRNQLQPAGSVAHFEVTATGAPPLRYQWYRNGQAISLATNQVYETAPVASGDNGAQFWVVVSNAFGVVTSQPPALLTLLTPPQILSQPQGQTVTNGDAVAMTVQVSSLAPPTYQWHNDNGAIAGETNATLYIGFITEGHAGPYWVIISNAAGPVSSEQAVLDVVSFDFGDAPDLVFAYSTRLVNNAARHRILPGWRLGALIDGELDGLAEALANGDDSIGSDDEDGVFFVGPVVEGRNANVDVVASTNGFLQGWMDMDANGTWTDAKDRIFLNAPLSPGTNHLSFLVPEGVVISATYGRFRFSSMVDLGPDGPAPDGEVEDYRMSVTHEADVKLMASVTPNPVAVGSNVTIVAAITNAGPSRARLLTLTNFLASQATFVSAQSSGGGSCSVLGNAVVCALNDLSPLTPLTVTLVVRANAAGSLTNRLFVFRQFVDPNYSDNVATLVTAVEQPPTIITPPASLTVSNGQPASFGVTASGWAPLSYQWFANGNPLVGKTSSTLSFQTVDPSLAGTYSVRVSNAVGAVTSAGAVLTVQVPPTDYGDAPAPYPTLRIDNGARHLIVAGVHLGGTP